MLFSNRLLDIGKIYSAISQLGGKNCQLVVIDASHQHVESADTFVSHFALDILAHHVLLHVPSIEYSRVRGCTDSVGLGTPGK
jgi:hypothetical protein